MFKNIQVLNLPEVTLTEQTWTLMSQSDAAGALGVEAGAPRNTETGIKQASANTAKKRGRNLAGQTPAT